MGLKMLDVLCVFPIASAGFAYWLAKRNEIVEAERLKVPAAVLASTGDKELDAALGISTVASLLVPKT